MIHGHPQRRHITRRVIGGVCVVTSILGLVMLINSVFSLQSVEVVGKEITIEINKKLLHTNLLFIPTETVRKQLLKDYMLLSDVEIQKKYPHTIRLIPHLRLPVARLQTHDKIVLIDRDGWIVGDESNPIPTNLPLLDFDIGEVYTGMQTIDARILSSISFVINIPEDMRIDRITKLDSTSFRVTSDTIDIYIPQLSDMKKIGATLQTLLTGFRIKGKLPVTIDLRFDKPVVTF